MDEKDKIKAVKNMANIALLIGFVALIFDRVIPNTSVPYILISFAGLISIIGFILLITWYKPENLKSNNKDKSGRN